MHTLLPAHPDGAAIRALFLADEQTCVGNLLRDARYNDAGSARVQAMARQWVAAMRERHAVGAGIESFLHQYDLSTD